ncbi:MAG TPA: PQQ-dependent sugar dehydrogenase [Luteimonas sp.]|nr:PQQ-dependent sugar dehydrogenase [Luteimonas sp.]
MKPHTGRRSLLLALLCAVALPACGAKPATSSDASAAAAGVGRTDAGRSAAITTIAHGLEHPWAVALLDDGSFLVTERPGRLRRVTAQGAISAPIAGVPQVWAQGQAGLLDLELAPDFARSHRIYFSYIEPGDNGTAGTAAATATVDGNSLRDLKVIYREAPKISGTANLGSRIAFDGKGHVFITQGDRFDRMRAQSLSVAEGKLMRLDMDGGVPTDNPFVGRKDALPQIWSYGHRNSQGLAIDPRTGTLWESEHGPRGGDEINLPERGKNYGWPIASNGMDYSTDRPYPETVGASAPGMESPHYVWKKSPGLSGMAFLVGHPELAWNNSLFLGALADRNLIRLSLDGNRIVGEERLLGDLGARIRDVRVGKEGGVYVLTDEDDGRLLRLQPPAATH